MRPLHRDPSVPPLAYTVPQAADALALGERTVYRLVATGVLKSVAVGRKLIVPVAECEAFLAREAS